MERAVVSQSMNREVKRRGAATAVISPNMCISYRWDEGIVPIALLCSRLGCDGNGMASITSGPHWQMTAQVRRKNKPSTPI